MCITLPCGYSTQTLTKVIAYCEIVLNFIVITIWMIFATILEARPDLLRDVVNDKPRESQEIIVLLELPTLVQTCLIFWIFVNLFTSLMLSVVLLRGAQERDFKKVRIWFIFTIISFILWLPIVIVWAIYSLEPVNIIFLTLLNYIFRVLSVSVIYSFMEDLRIENITHRPGYKTYHIAFDKI